VPISHTLLRHRSRARPSWPANVKAALEEYDPLASDIPSWGLHLLERGLPLLPRLVAGLVGDISDRRVGLAPGAGP